MRCRRLSILGAAVLLAMLAVALSAPLGAGECPHGQLDARFCDADGDLVADPPAASQRHNDPRVLVFAYTPVEDPALYRAAWEPFLAHLAQVTGKRVMYFPVQSNAAQIEAMRAGRLHVAGFNTGSVPYAVNAAGFVPFAMMAHDDGSFGYEMELITHVDSGITSVSQLRGRKIAFSSPTSNSGYKAPKALLASEFGLEADRDYEAVFSGKHDNSILGVVHRDYDAAPVASEILRRMVERDMVDPAKLRTIYRSETFPSTAYGHAHDLDPALIAKIREAFFSFPWEGSTLLAEFGDNAGTGFIPITYAEHWAVIRKIDAANGVTYTPGR